MQELLERDDNPAVYRCTLCPYYHVRVLEDHDLFALIRSGRLIAG